MKISYNWLQTFFDTPLPPTVELESLLTFHSSEIEEVEVVGADTMIDVKVLPDKSAWLMSHRGVAKEISTIIGKPLTADPFLTIPQLSPMAQNIEINLETTDCDYYGSALITGVKMGPSPDWLVSRLKTIGQRSINNVVDATNYVMFELGQPLHAFDAEKIGIVDGKHKIVVRGAKPDEKITTLTGEDFEMQAGQTLIVDGSNDSAIAIAGIKGGKQAAVDASTTSLLLEAAHFDRVKVRNTSKVIKLRTDASARYENGISVAIAPIALTAAVELITKIAEGSLVGYASVGSTDVSRATVSTTLTRIKSVLGVQISLSEVEDIIKRFGYLYNVSGEEITVTPPFERDDLVIAEDLIEDIGRIYGMDKIVAIAPTVQALPAFNNRHYYAEKIRGVLLAQGFSEIFTSSFRNVDEVKIKNALASDKSFLRSNLSHNIREAVIKNIPYRDLLGLTHIAVFEIGSVFNASTESFNVAIGVQTGTSYKTKVDDVLLTSAKKAIETELGSTIEWTSGLEGVIEFSLDGVLDTLPKITAYDTVKKGEEKIYQAFSLYPSVSRDIALWVPEETSVEEVVNVLKDKASTLCVRLTHLDTFSKEGRTSLAFRLVFQSKEKTLDGSVVDELMKVVYDATAKASWEVR